LIIKFRVFSGFLLSLIVSIDFAQSIKISAVQMLAHQQLFEEFKTDISKYVEQAKSEHSDIVVFPENNMLNIIFDSPWKKEHILQLSQYYNKYKSYISELS
jgi:predicted amidohydrolase